MMTTQNRPVGDTELAVLKVLWDLDEGTVRDVLAGLKPDTDWAYTTAQTLLTRLQGKGFVESEKRGRAFVFRPSVSRDELVGQGLEQLAARVCDGASMPLLLNLVQSSTFDQSEIASFRRLLDKLEKGES
jgi:BlaI family penicillinase repressor